MPAGISLVGVLDALTLLVGALPVEKEELLVEKSPVEAWPAVAATRSAGGLSIPAALAVCAGTVAEAATPV